MKNLDLAFLDLTTETSNLNDFWEYSSLLPSLLRGEIHHLNCCRAEQYRRKTRWSTNL